MQPNLFEIASCLLKIHLGFDWFYFPKTRIEEFIVDVVDPNFDRKSPSLTRPSPELFLHSKAKPAKNYFGSDRIRLSDNQFTSNTFNERVYVPLIC